MAILENIQDLPQPAKIGLAGVAVGGVVVLLLKRAASTPTATAQEAQRSTAGPVLLPPGAEASNAGEVQQNTMALIQGLINTSQDSTRTLIDTLSSQTQTQLAAQNAALVSAQQSLSDQQVGQQNALLAIINALKSQIDAFTKPSGPVAEPAPQTTSPPPAKSPQPSAPGQPTSSNPDNYGKTKYLGDVKSYIGGVQSILNWLGGSDYGIESSKHGGKGTATKAGATDYNTGIILATNYDVNKDKLRFDWSTHQNAESAYARVMRQTINLMQSHPELSQYEAQLMILSELKNGIGSASLYDTGFDYSNVPDNYGRGTYWK